MYSKIYLTNPNNTPLSLSNEHFDNEFLLTEDLYDCNAVEDAVKIIDSHKPLHTFSILRDSIKKTIFVSEDPLGNIRYLVCVK